LEEFEEGVRINGEDVRERKVGLMAINKEIG